MRVLMLNTMQLLQLPSQVPINNFHLFLQPNNSVWSECHTYHVSTIDSPSEGILLCWAGHVLLLVAPVGVGGGEEPALAVVLLTPGQHRPVALLPVRAIGIGEPEQSRGRGPHMGETGVGILLQISLQPLQRRSDRPLKGAWREDALFVA